VQANIANVLTHIAHEAVGQINAAVEPNLAIEVGLLPVLEDRLTALSKANPSALDAEWQRCLPHINVRTPPPLVPSDVAILNAFYHVDERVEMIQKTTRGAIVSIPSEVLSKGNISEQVFGKENSLYKIMETEFLLKGSEEDRQRAADQTILGWLEIGSVCDHAQKKHKLHRYLLAALIPIEYEGLTIITEEKDKGVKKIKSDRRHDAIYRFPVLAYKGNQYVLKVSFRYQIGAHTDSEVLGEPLFRIKAQILNEVAFRWGQHSIRPGITSFK
jgi:hypothetical protein